MTVPTLSFFHGVQFREHSPDRQTERGRETDTESFHHEGKVHSRNLAEWFQKQSVVVQRERERERDNSKNRDRDNPTERQRYKHSGTDRNRQRETQTDRKNRKKGGRQSAVTTDPEASESRSGFYVP